MKLSRKKSLQLLIAFFLSGLFLYLSYKKIGNIDYAKIKEYKINYLYILVGVAFFNLSVLIRAFLWSGILSPELKLNLSYKALFLGMASNLVLPFRLGEVVKIAVFRNGYYTKTKSEKANFYINVGSNMAIERLTDLLLMLASCISALYFIKFNELIAARIMLFRNISVVLVLLLLLLIIIIKNFKLYNKIKYNWFIKVLNLFNNIKDKLKLSKLLKVIVLLVVAWFTVYFSILFSLIGLGVDFEIVKTAAFIILIMTNLAVIFPAAPGGLGLFEYACIYSLGLFGITGVTAALAAIILHLVQYVAVIPVAMMILIVYRDKAIIKEIKLSRYK